MTGTELTRRHAAAMPDKVAYARELAHSGLLPDAYRKQPANVLYAVEYGDMLGLSPMAAITGIHVIKGRPTASAGLISALVRRAGHRLRVSVNEQRAVAEIVRKDDQDFTFRSEWTMDRAVTAKLCTIKDGKPYARDNKGEPTPWEKFPLAMLKHRAVTEVARDACEEALFGLHYTPEELGADVDEEGQPVQAQAERADQPAEAHTGPWSRINALLSHLRVPQADVVPLVCALVERTVASAGELGEQEVTALLGKLEGLAGTTAGEQQAAELVAEQRERAAAQQQDGQVVDAEIVPDTPAEEPADAADTTEVPEDATAAATEPEPAQDAPAARQGGGSGAWVEIQRITAQWQLDQGDMLLLWGALVGRTVESARDFNHAEVSKLRRELQNMAAIPGSDAEVNRLVTEARQGQAAGQQAGTEAA